MGRQTKVSGELYTISFNANEFAIVLQALRLFAQEEGYDDASVLRQSQRLFERLEDIER